MSSEKAKCRYRRSSACLAPLDVGDLPRPIAVTAVLLTDALCC